jgi:CPA1 family monovalent cation:H+ antiporter
MTTVAGITLGFALLLTLMAPLPPLAARIRLPYTVLLAVLGCALGLVTGLADQFAAQDDFGIGEILRAVSQLEVSSAVFLWVFLPLILFDSAIELDGRALIEDIGPVFLMAVVAVAATTAISGLAIWSVTSFSLAACLLVGAIIATTDPIAVINVFREVGAPRRLVSLVEGESLLNDAAAIAITSSLLAIVVGLSAPSVEEAVAGFGLALVGGAVFGMLIGRLAGALLARLDDAGPAEVTLSVALAYLTYALAELFLGLSGVVAVITAGIVFGSQGRAHLSRSDWRALSAIWTQLSFWASSLIFVLAAMLAPKTLASASLGDVALLALLIVSALFARALMIYGALPLMEVTGLAARVQTSYKHVMLWGGLRGAITLALALAVTENPRVPPPVQHLVAVLATGYVLFTLFVQATTLHWLMRWLGLDRLSPLEDILRGRALKLARGEILDTLRDAAAERGLDPASVDVVAQDYQSGEGAASQPLAEDMQRRQLVTALLALSRREAELYVEERARRMMSRAAGTVLIREVRSLIDTLRSEGLDGYRRMAREQLGLDRQTRIAAFLYRILRIEQPLARRLTGHLEQNIVQRFVLREVMDFNELRIRALFGERVAEVAALFMQSRLERVERAIDALRLQYPDYWRSFGERYLRLAALRLEYAAVEQLEAERLLPPQVAQKMSQTLKGRRSHLERPPHLDLGLRTEVLIRQLPLFAKLDDAEIKRLSRKLQTRLALPGERIVRRGDPGDAMFFIASGAVEVRVQPEPIRLGTGEFFGELALLTRRPRTADVVAIGYCRLLVLRRELFDDVLKSHSVIGRRVREVASGRHPTEPPPPGMTLPSD